MSLAKAQYLNVMEAEKELKNAIKSGNSAKAKRAFERLYVENARLIYRALIDSFGKDAETDDDVQESFLGLLKNPQRLLTIDSIVAYWMQSAKYIASHRREKERRLAPIDEAEEIPDSGQSIPELLQGKELFGQIETWLGHPDSTIVILWLAYGLSQKEIALKLGMSVDAVCYRYRKSIKELRRRLKDEKK